MPSLSINGQSIEVASGETILSSARRLGITIPTLCYHPDLSTVGSCRLCLVEVDGVERQFPACSTPVMERMVVRTETAAVIHSRRQVLQLLLNHFHGSLDSGELAEGEFSRWVRHYGIRPAETFSPRFVVDSDPHPLIQVDLNKCILCTRCIRACNEVQGRFVWHLAQRGQQAHVVPGTGTTMLEARCESCGACAAYCPTGALIDRAAITAPLADRLVKTTCGYCGVGCQFDLNVIGDRVVRVTSNRSAPANGMALCVKGRYGQDYIHHADRLKQPCVRSYLLEQAVDVDRPSDRGDWMVVSWETALEIVSKKLSYVRDRYGPSALGVFSSAKCTNEENYLVQKLARQLLRTNNVDHCARLCHSSTVAGLTMALGSGAMSNSLEDVAEMSAAIFVIGSNTTEQHPVFGSRLRQAVLRRGVKLVVADPRRVDIAEFATLYLRQQPGTDVALLNGLMHLIVSGGAQNQAFIDARCEGYAEFAESLDRYPPEVVSKVTGVLRRDLERAAEILSGSRPMAAVWAMGITQHRTGVLNVLALANLQLLLGNLGIPGGGVNPLRGQNNVQGACDMGALPNVFPGYQSVSDTVVSSKFNCEWKLIGSSEWLHEALPNETGLTVTEMIDAAGTGDVRALYMIGEDPVMTEPDVNHVRRCLERCEFLVLQEIFPSETSVYADVLLPGASFAEKDGTFTNTERRIQRVAQAIRPIGDALPDWQIVARLGQLLQHQALATPSGRWSGWEYAHPSQIMREISALTPLMAGVSYERLGDNGLQWPVPDEKHPGTPILYADDFPRGKAQFHIVDHLEQVELPSSEYPLVLTTGRVLYHWHGGEMSRRVRGLVELCPDPLVEIAPQDARRLRIASGSEVRLVSRRGEMVARALVSNRVPTGVVFGNFHFTQSSNVNNLTIKALDPIAKIPEYKVCAVRIAPLLTNSVGPESATEEHWTD